MTSYVKGTIGGIFCDIYAFDVIRSNVPQLFHMLMVSDSFIFYEYLNPQLKHFVSVGMLLSEEKTFLF